MQNGDYFEGNATAIQNSVNDLNMATFAAAQKSFAAVQQNLQNLQANFM